MIPRALCGRQLCSFRLRSHQASRNALLGTLHQTIRRRSFHSSRIATADVATTPAPTELSPSSSAMTIPPEHMQLFNLGVLPSADAIENPSPRVVAIMKEMLTLTQFEALQMNKVFTDVYGAPQQLNFAQAAAPSVAAASAAPAAASPAVDQAAADAAAAAAAAAAKPTTFTVKLQSFAAADKIKVIKEVRAATGLGLKESKDLVEGAPKVVKKDMNKADADALVEKLKAAGAVIVLE